MSRRKNLDMALAVCIFLVALAVAVPAPADTHYVSPGQSIQAAIDDANDGDEIEVAPGTYYEAIDFSGKAVRLYSSGGPNITTIDGTGNYHVVQCINGEDANTILDGFTITGGNANGGGADAAGGGMHNYYTSPTVTNCTFSANEAKWNGGAMYNNYSSPTVTNCNFYGNSTANGANGSNGGDAGNGAAMGNRNNSSPTVTNCTFSGNVTGNGGNGSSYPSSGGSGGNGAGIYNESSSPTVTGCTFSGNITGNGGNGRGSTFPLLPGFGGHGGNGAGMYNDNSSPTVTSCTFSQNVTGDGGDALYMGSGGNGGSGAGTYNTNSSPTSRGCTFNGNITGYGGSGNLDNGAQGVGGGMSNSQTSSPTVTGCRFSNNTAGWGAGTYNNLTSSPKVTGCTFTDNTASVNGGGMYNANNSRPTVTNCTFMGNGALSGTYGGGGMFNNTTNPTVTNCTFTDNTASTRGGGLYNYSCSPTVTNCILWGNTAPTGPQIYGNAIVEYSDVEGGWGGTGSDNIDADPCFVDALWGDVRLRSWASPCVDTGDNLALPPDAPDLDGDGNTTEPIPFDLLGNPRVFDGNSSGFPQVDMGAYELSQVHNVTQDLYYSTIQGAIDEANPYDDIDVAPGTYYEAIDFKGKAIHVYSSDGPEVTTIHASRSVLLSEDFSDGDYAGWDICDQGTASGPSVWSAETGEMVQTSNILSAPLTDPNMLGTFAWWQSGLWWTDYEATLTMRSSDDDGIGVMFRYQDPNNYYRFTWLRQDHSQEVGRRRLVKCQDGQFEVLDVDDVFYNMNQDYQVGIVASGADLQIFIDGALVLSARDSACACGSIALYCWGNQNAYFDDVSVVGAAGHVVQCVSGEGPNTILDGFTITGGSANGPDPNDRRGGGMRNFNSSPTVTDCNFSGNAALEGGGMCNWNNSSPTVNNCTFSRNTATYGAGIHNNFSSRPTITNCAFSGNTATYGAGIHSNHSSRPTITNCAFSGNTAGNNGGGMYNTNSSSPTLTNCTFTGNTAADKGGAIFSYNGSPTATNCILWADTPHEFYDIGGVPTVTYSDVQGGYTGTGNINADPLFLDAPGGDFRLISSGSPCVDAGDNSVVTEPDDLAGNARIVDGDLDGSAVVDMGAFEFNARIHNITQDCWYEEIQLAIDCASEGDELVLEPDIFYEAIDFAGKAITLRSNDPNDPNVVAATIIDATGLNLPVVTCVSGEGPDTVLAGVTLTGGSSESDGGGMYNYGSSPTVTHCVIRGNSAEYGGGMSNIISSPTAINCIFRDNSATDGGGMYNFDASSPTVTNCTFTANTAGEGCGMYNLDSSPIVTNCILWGNWGDTPDEICDSNSTTAVTYCDVQGGYPGPNNIDIYPMFVDSGGGDLHLGWGSACIDAGNNSAAGLPATDMEGRPRVLDGHEDGSAIADLGPYEYDTVMPGAFLQVTISPAEAITDGAQWRLDGEGPWFEAGDAVAVSPGYHDVDFTNLSSWSEPEMLLVEYDDDPNDAALQSLSVRVIGDMVTYATAEYEPLAVLNIGEIPPWDAPHGSTVEFYIDANWIADPCFQIVDVNAQPVGDYSIDPYSGLFTYEPNDVNDRTPFTITFRVSSGADVNEQTVEITPVPQLPPEFAIVSAPSQNLPDANSRDYIIVNEILSDANEVLNGRERQVRSLTIAGKFIVVSDGLVSVYSDAHDIREMTIYAETLVVDEPLNLPQTNVTIYARDLHFDGAMVDINTTPIDDRIDTGEPMDGLQGGDISLYIESFDPGSGGHPPLKMEGTAALNGGRPGCGGAVMSTLHTPQPLAWLSPYALKMVIAHAKDAYLYGYAQQTKDILEEYQALLSTHLSLYDPCSANPVYELEDSNWILAFRQMHDEAVTLIHRIENGLDYFGNPPHWVPMLSFEVTRAFFDQEIDRTIRILYLSYWIQNTLHDKQAKADGLTSARAKLWEETDAFRSNYSSVNGLLPGLEWVAGNASQQIGEILSDLQNKEQQLLQRAQDNVKERHKVPWWKKVTKFIATVATYTFLGASKHGQAGAALGAAGGVCSVVNDLISEPDPWAEVYRKTDVVQQFNNIDFDQAADASLDQFNGIQQGDIETYGAEGYLQSLRASSAQIADGMSAVKDALKETVLDNAEVEAELRKIKATDVTFNWLVDRVTQLMAEKEVLNRQLAASMQEISTLSDAITNNILSIDAMNRQASNSVIDPRVAIYARDMELRARNRLLKYHYYMAKAYEYRLLRAYPEDLNIHSVFSMIQKFVDVNEASHELTSDEWGDLKAVYDDLLAGITWDIYDDYINNWATEYRTSVTLTLTSDEIARLNAKLPVRISFMERDMFMSYEESIRVSDINILSMSLHAEGPNTSPDDYLVLYIEHSGFSKLQFEQDIYGFVHHTDNTDNPVNWNYRCWVDTFEPIPRSPASESLLYSLLDKWGGTGHIMLYTRPAAWADIVITNVPRGGNQGEIVIDSLRLKLWYDYTDQLDPGPKDLHVLTSPADLQPYILVDKEDVSARQDGRGDFYRRYNIGTTVKLTAPAVYGDWEFVKWGSQTTGNPVLEVQLSSDTTAEARYKYVGPLVSVADFNGDLSVDMRDFSILAGAWLTVPQHEEWEGACDISSPADYFIDEFDLKVLCDDWLASL